MSNQTKSEFPQTRNSLVVKFNDVDAGVRQMAIEEFAENYRKALISFLVKCKNVNTSDAEDVVHDFLLNKILNGKILELASKKGRFRSLLRTCLQNYLIDRLRNEHPSEKRFSLEVGGLVESEGQNICPLDQVWAIALFRDALLKMKTESEYWGVFKDRVLTQPPLPYPQVIMKYGFENPTKASNGLMTAKRQFNRIIEELVAKQTSLTDEFSEAALEQEIGYLRTQLADTKLLEFIVDSLDESTELESKTKEATVKKSIFRERLLLIDEDPDSNWGKSDTVGILNHLLNQPVCQILDDGTQDKLIDVFNALNNLDVLHNLKEHFNRNAKSKSGSLPERVYVTMTFACIGAFLLAGGELDTITSTRKEKMAERIDQLTNKKWLPNQLRCVFLEAGQILK